MRRNVETRDQFRITYLQAHIFIPTKLATALDTNFILSANRGNEKSNQARPEENEAE